MSDLLILPMMLERKDPEGNLYVFVSTLAVANILFSSLSTVFLSNVSFLHRTKRIYLTKRRF